MACAAAAVQVLKCGVAGSRYDRINTAWGAHVALLDGSANPARIGGSNLLMPQDRPTDTIR
eukprot:scaffold10828_cov143-Isochrysis_galbana.AAC.5